MTHRIVAQAEQEIIRFLVRRPSLEEIAAMHLSDEAAAQLYDLIYEGRERELTEDEQRALDEALYLNHLMSMLKIEAHSILGN